MFGIVSSNELSKAEKRILYSVQKEVQKYVEKEISFAQKDMEKLLRQFITEFTKESGRGMDFSPNKHNLPFSVNQSTNYIVSLISKAVRNR